MLRFPHKLLSFLDLKNILNFNTEKGLTRILFSHFDDCQAIQNLPTGLWVVVQHCTTPLTSQNTHLEFIRIHRKNDKKKTQNARKMPKTNLFFFK